MISSDQAKAIAILAALGLAGFVAYRVYRTGEDAAASVSETFDNIGDAFGDFKRKLFPTEPPPLSELPSNDDYPEAGPIRAAQTKAENESIGGRIRDLFGIVNDALFQNQPVQVPESPEAFYP